MWRPGLSSPGSTPYFESILNLTDQVHRLGGCASSATAHAAIARDKSHPYSGACAAFQG
jgi:hypothetical protein